MNKNGGNDERVELSAILPGATVHPLDEGYHALDAFILLRCHDEDGDVTWSFRTTSALNLEELLGALVVQVELLRNKLVAHWDDEDD